LKATCCSQLAAFVNAAIEGKWFKNSSKISSISSMEKVTPEDANEETGWDTA
jgi:hypothetical protein